MIEHLSPISGIDAGHSSWVATAGYDNQVILWDRASRRATARATHDHLANQCQFSPDGRLLVSASSDYSARVWSLPDLRLQAVLGDHEDDVEMAAFDPSGDRIATASRDHRVRIFARTGQLLHRLTGHEADALSLSWSEDGLRLTSSGDDGTVRTWCATTGELLDTIRLDGVETDTVAVDSDGTIYAGNDHGQIVWIRRGQVQIVDAHAAGIKRLALDRRRRQLVSTSYDRNLALWSIAADGSIARVRSVTLPAVIWARSCAFDPDGRIVLGTFGSSYAVYDASSGEWDLRGVHDTRGINAVCAFDGGIYTVGDAGVVRRDGREHARMGSLCNFFVALGGRLFTGGHLGAVMDASTGRTLYQHRSPLNCAVAVTLGQTPAIIVGSYTGEGIVLRDGGDGGLALVTSLALHDQAVKGIAAGDRRLFSVSAAADCAIHDLPELRLVARLPRAHHQIANGVAALPDGRFASVSRDRKLRIWQDDTSRVLDTPHDHSIKCICTSSSGRWIATGSYDGKIAVLDLAGGGWQVHRPTTAGISSLARSTAPDQLLASSYDGRCFAIDPAAPAGAPLRTVVEVGSDPSRATSPSPAAPR